MQTKDKLFNFRPVFFVAVFLCFGVLFGYFHVIYGVSAWWSFSLLPVLVASFFLCKDGAGIKRTLIALVSLAVAFLVGLGSFVGQIRSFTKTEVYDGDGVVVGTVVDKVEYGGQTMLVLDELYINGRSEKGLLKAYFPVDVCEDVRLCDEVVAKGWVKTQTELTGSYGFRADAVVDDVRFSLKNGVSCIKGGENFQLFLYIRGHVEKVLNKGMDETSAGVCMAVLTGNRTGIDGKLMSNMQYGGIAHIFAVSGLHVGALYAFCLLLFAKTPLKNLPKVGRFVSLFLLLFFYAGVCGFSASVLRATVLCLTSYFAMLLGVSNDSLETLGLACIVVVMLSPCHLFGVGFQLSFLACLGIILLARPIGQVCDEICFAVGRLRKNKKEIEEEIKEKEDVPPSVAEGLRRKTVSLLSASLSAQIMTTPVLIMSFGYVSALSLVLNFIFVPFMSATFALLLLFVVVSCVLPFSFAPIVLYAPSVLWALVLLVFDFVDFSAFAWTNIPLTVLGAVCYYLGCLFLTDKWNVSRTLKGILSSVCFLTFALSLII